MLLFVLARACNCVWYLQLCVLLVTTHVSCGLFTFITHMSATLLKPPALIQCPILTVSIFYVFMLLFVLARACNCVWYLQLCVLLMTMHVSCGLFTFITHISAKAA